LRSRDEGKRQEVYVRVSTVSVGDVLGEERSLVINSPLLGELGSLVASKDVHRVDLDHRATEQSRKNISKGISLGRAVGERADLDTGNDVSSLEVLGVHGGSLGGSSHTVLVVLADEGDGKVPELGL
jgi:hypothetical protein